MAIYSITNPFSANTLIQSAQVNANFTEISTAINTTLFSGSGDSLLTTKGGTGLTTYSTGDLLYASASNTLSKLAAGTNGQVLTQGASVPSWVAAPTANDPSMLINLGLACTVGSNALTVNLKQADGSTAPGAGASAVQISMRSSTATNGNYNIRSAIAATSLTVSSGSTLGTRSGVGSYLWVYAIDNSGTIELAISSTRFDDGSIVSTTTEGGAGGADNAQTMYSTTGRSNVPCRLIARLASTQTTAGTWAAVPTEVSVGHHVRSDEAVFARFASAATQNINNAAFTAVTAATTVYDTHNGWDGTNTYTVRIAGFYEVSGIIEFADHATGSRYIEPYLNGSGATGTIVRAGSSATNSGRQSFCAPIIKCAVGDTLAVYIQQTSGSAMTINPNTPSVICIKRLTGVSAQ